MSALMHVKPVAPRSRAPFVLAVAVVAVAGMLSACSGKDAAAQGAGGGGGMPPVEVGVAKFVAPGEVGGWE